MGETSSEVNPELRSAFIRYFGDFDNAMTALLIDQPLLGMRMKDVAAAIDFLALRPEADMQRLSAYGYGSAGVVLLHAASLDERIRNVILEGTLVSLESVIDDKLHWKVFEQVVPSALSSYDFPELACAVAPRRVLIVNASSPRGKRLAVDDVLRTYSLGGRACRLADDALRAVEREPGERLSQVASQLLGSTG